MNNIKKVIFFPILVICLIFHCQNNDLNQERLKKTSERDLSKYKASEIIGKVKVGMTLEQVLKILDVEEYKILPIQEHGGDWYRFRICKSYAVDIRFTRDCIEQDSIDCVVNLEPRLNKL
jgi:hypothetical protein